MKRESGKCVEDPQKIDDKDHDDVTKNPNGLSLFSVSRAFSACLSPLSSPEIRISLFRIKIRDK